MILNMNLGEHSYDIILERGILNRVSSLLPPYRRVLVVTDDGVPAEYAARAAKGISEPVIVTIPQGEASKSFSVLEMLCRTMLEHGFTRTDAVIAVGGGVVGDLSGFAAACYMRGIDFYNIPTTLLSQVDSSIGGKTAIDLAGIKNCIGAFHQPKKVLIDPETLATLPPRQVTNGLAEAIKMAATSDAALFRLMEKENIPDHLDTIIEKSLRIKKYVVENDEKETGLRRVLNFGHTLGHGIESCEELHGLYHGECVALGMLPMCAPEVKQRLISVLKKAGLPVFHEFDLDRALAAITHDKKLDGDRIRYVYVPEIGRFELKTASLSDFISMIKEAYER